MDMIQSLKKLIAIPSVTDAGEGGYPYGAGPAKALDQALDMCQDLGFRTVNRDYRYGYAEIGQGSDVIIILGHLDVVPAGDGWITLPYEPDLRDGRIYGRGTIDDKGPMVAAAYAMKDLLDSGIPLNRRIRILFGQTEENGNNDDIADYIAEEGLPAGGFTPDSDFPAIIGEKGILITKVSMPLESSGIISAEGGNAPNMVPDHCVLRTSGGTYEASGKSAHGSMPWEGENAITSALSRVLADEPDCLFASMYRDLFAGDHHGVHAGIGFEDSMSGKLTVNPGIIQVQDGQIELILDIRYPVTVDHEHVLEGLNRKLAPYGAAAAADFRMPKVWMSPEEPVVTALLDAYREITGDRSEPIVIGGATYAREMPGIVAFGPMMAGMEKTEHMANEYIEVDHLNVLRKIYFRAIWNLMERL